MENCEDHVKVATRQKVREFCNQLMESFSKERPPIYLLATLVDVNKADNFDTEKTVQVIILIRLRQPFLLASLSKCLGVLNFSCLWLVNGQLSCRHNSYHFMQGNP